MQGLPACLPALDAVIQRPGCQHWHSFWIKMQRFAGQHYGVLSFKSKEIWAQEQRVRFIWLALGTCNTECSVCTGCFQLLLPSAERTRHFQGVVNMTLFNGDTYTRLGESYPKWQREARIIYTLSKLTISFISLFYIQF